MKSHNRFHFLILLLILLLSIMPDNSVMAQEATPSDDEVNRIASQLYCPVCENIPLDVCGLEACVQWRALIRQQIADGWTEQEIKDHFVAQYGDRVLGEPPRRGLNWLLYVLPPIVVLTGLAVLMVKLKRSPAEPPAGYSIDDEDHYLKQVERDLEKMEN